MASLERFGRRFLFVPVLICALTLAVAPARAGQVSSATIFGQVKDQSGAVLPGVTVTVTSPALQVQQMVEVTDANGEYRVTPLPIGSYTVEFALSGFQSRRNEDVRLTEGFVARVDVALNVGTVAETLTVSGQSPVVDVKTTSAGTHVTREILESVPTARNSFNSLLTLAAGARPISDTRPVRGTNPVIQAFGRSGSNAWLTVDGLSVTSPNETPGFETSSNFEAVEEATVTTLGSSAEAPTSGVQMNIVTKSGSNQFHGGALVAETSNWMQASNNLDDRLRAQGLQQSPKFSTRRDRGGDLGGRFVRDRLWFYGATRQRPERVGVLGSFNCDGSPAEFITSQRFVNSKLTGQLTDAQQLTGAFNWRGNFQDTGARDRFNDCDTRYEWDTYTKQGYSQWQMVKGNTVVWVQGGGHIPAFLAPNLSQFSQKPSYTDQVTTQIGGIQGRVGGGIYMSRWQGKGTLNWYKQDLIKGNHDFKVGGEYQLTRRDDVAFDRGEPGNYTLVYRSGLPFQVQIKNAPAKPLSRLANLGIFFRDSWTLNRRLTLDLGVRYANDQAWLPPQCRDDATAPFAGLFPAQCFPEKHLKTYNPLMPRLHAAYDLTGDGKTVVKGGWGRFYGSHTQEELNPFNPNGVQAATFAWTDLNRNQRWDVGESNLNFNGPDFVTIQNISSSVLAAQTGLVDNPDLKARGDNEFTASVERELIPNFAIRVTGVYTSEFNTVRLLNTLRPYSAFNIPITNRDPGPDNILGNADDPGTALTYWDYPASLRGLAFQRPMYINDSASDANYKSIDVAASKRFSNRWQLLASYSGTKRHIPVPARAAYDPNTEINAADDRWEWLTRVSGSYLFPLGIQASTNILVQSGIPYARTVSVRGGVQIPSITLRTEPLGAHQTPTQTLVAVNAEKVIRLKRNHQLTVGANIYNLLNANFDEDAAPQAASGARFGYSNTIALPRMGEATLRYKF